MRKNEPNLPKNNCYVCVFLMNGFWCQVHNNDVAGNSDKTCHHFEQDEISTHEQEAPDGK